MRPLQDLRLPVAGILTLVVAILGVLGTTSWIGNPFPGFLVLENRVVASAGLTRWPAVQDGSLYQAEIVSVDGVAIDDVALLHERVAMLPTGTPIEYEFRLGESSFVRAIPTRSFETVDFFPLFGVYLLGGLAMCGVGLALVFLRRGDPVAEGTAVALWVIGMWALTATDLYGPYHLFRFHAGLECLLFATALHLAVTFPYPNRVIQRSPQMIVATYAMGGLLACAMQLGLYDPSWYVSIHRLAIALFGVSLAVLVGSQLFAWIRPPTYEARQRVRVLMIGIVLAAAPGLALALGSAMSGGRVSENAMGWTGIFLPLSVGYAVLRTNLFEVDTFLRKALNYGATSLLLTVLYAAAIAVVEQLIQGQNPENSGQLMIATSALALFVLLPFRDRLQFVIDRLFFRNVVDLRRIIDTTSEKLASVADLDIIAEEIATAVHIGMQPEWVLLEVFTATDSEARSLCFGAIPEPFGELRDTLEVDGDHIEEFDRALSIPFRVEGRRVAVLFVGPRMSGRFFDGEDLRFLKTLSNQGGVAIENAMALEKLRELNQSLEEKVAARTSDLSNALVDLRETQDQLLHQEKLASVGRLVAGIAHEINNPVNFIEGNLQCLEENTAILRDMLRGYETMVAQEAPDLAARLKELGDRKELDYVLEDFDSIFEACHEGVERTTTIVRDLRTFSRSDSGRGSWVDLATALGSTLSLLRSRLTEVEIVREFDQVPEIFATEGQIKQVFMNLIDNALDAMEERGRLILRLAVEGDKVIAEVEDNGGGISAEAIEQIFDPFFTTKDVGKGTGLGLSISYGVIVEHGGNLRVASEPGKTCFTLELPIVANEAEAREG